MKKVRQMLKNQKGLTLVELLAVVVILGIISAIAIPSIGGLIDNTKKDAHVANAQQMVSAAKLVIAGNDVATIHSTKDDVHTIYLEHLVKNGYLDNSFIDPDTNEQYNISTGTGSKVLVKEIPADEDSGKQYKYSVILIGDEKKIGEKGTDGILSTDLDRSKVEIIK